MNCPNCEADYAEDFPNGMYCFGCGYRESQEKAVLKNHKKKPIELDLLYSYPSDRDYELIWDEWGINPNLVDLYKLYKAQSKTQSWLVMPVLDEYAVEIMAQFRAWTGPHKSKYLTTASPPPGTLWKSWHTSEGVKNVNLSHVAIVEGIADGIRLSEIMPTVALLGSDLNYDRLNTLLALDKIARYVIVLDHDAQSKAYTMQKALGLNRSEVVMLPSGDPTDYDRHELSKLLNRRPVEHTK